MYNLVLSGGGIRGILHLGSLKTLEEKNIFKNIKNFGGSSAGSMISLLLSIGYTYNDIMIIFLKINTDKFYDITDIFEFLNIYGLLNLNPFEKFLRLLLENKFKKKNITFSELYNLTQKTLHINSININSNEEIIFNHINTPNIDVIDACLASCSLPFIFPPKLIDNNYYIDAFAVNNCPCNIFKNDLDNTICLSIMDLCESNLKNNSFQNYVMNVFNSYKNYSYYITIKTFQPKILINLTYDCSPIDFDLSKDKLSEIFITGYNLTNTFFEKNPIDETNLKLNDKKKEENNNNDEETNNNNEEETNNNNEEENNTNTEENNNEDIKNEK